MRVVSLVPSNTEALCMLGLEDSLVGVTDYCVHPARVVGRIQPIGGTKNPRVHEIIALCPDLVIVNTDENRRQTFDRLKAVGLNVLVTHTDSLDEVERTWIRIGEATGTEEAAIACCENLVAARAYNRAALHDIDRIPTLVPVWRDPWIASGSGTYMESLLSECGFRNVLSRTGMKWIRIAFQASQETYETLLARWISRKRNTSSIAPRNHGLAGTTIRGRTQFAKTRIAPNPGECIRTRLQACVGD